MNRYRDDADCFQIPDIIVCPYCDNSMSDFDSFVVNRSPNKLKYQCNKCDKYFLVSADIKVEYTSTRLDETGKEITEWSELIK